MRVAMRSATCLRCACDQAGAGTLPSGRPTYLQLHPPSLSVLTARARRLASRAGTHTTHIAPGMQLSSHCSDALMSACAAVSRLLYGEQLGPAIAKPLAEYISVTTSMTEVR